MNDINGYYYCMTHKVCILPEDMDKSQHDGCDLIFEDFKIRSTHRKIRLQWAAKSIGEKYGMKIFHSRKVKADTENTLPPDAILIDSLQLKGRDLNGRED